MMRVTTLAALLALGGCAHLPLFRHGEPRARVASEPRARVTRVAATANPSCRLDTVTVLEGRPGSAVVAAQALDLSGARTVRWLRPGASVTADVQPDRLDIWLTRDKLVRSFSCG